MLCLVILQRQGIVITFRLVMWNRHWLNDDTCWLCESSSAMSNLPVLDLIADCIFTAELVLLYRVTVRLPPSIVRSIPHRCTRDCSVDAAAFPLHHAQLRMNHSTNPDAPPRKLSNQHQHIYIRIEGKGDENV